MTDAKPVFDAIVRYLLRLFGTRYAVVQLLQDGINTFARRGWRTEFRETDRLLPATARRGDHGWARDALEENYSIFTNHR